MVLGGNERIDSYPPIRRLNWRIEWPRLGGRFSDLVSICVRDAEVPGSNPGSPTQKSLFRVRVQLDASLAWHATRISS